VIHLDTNVLIEALVPGSETDQALRRWLLAGESVWMSSIA
jgi:predicted nucleic acid-binding protein